MKRIRPKLIIAIIFYGAAVSLASSGDVSAATPLSLPPPLTPTQAPVTALSASDFLNSIGINTHAGITDPSNTYSHTNLVLSALNYAKIKHARDDLSIGPQLSVLAYLYANLHVTFDLAYGYYASDGGTTVIAGDINNVQSSAYLIEAIEGPNEPDYFGVYYNGATGGPAVVGSQQFIFNSVRGNASLANKPVYCPSLSYPGPGGLSGAIGNLGPYCTYGNSHDYVVNNTFGVLLPYQSVKVWTGFPATTIAPGLPVVITEGGWSTLATSGAGVDEISQAKYTADFLFDAFSQGVPRTYLYELLDDAADPTSSVFESHFGVFRTDGSPKPAATMLANLATVLTDAAGPVCTHAARALTYSVSGMPANGHQLLLQTPNGIFVLALWNEANLWNASTQADIPLPSVPVLVNFGTQLHSVQIIDPVGGTVGQTPSARAETVTVSVPDHPVLVFIDPNGPC